MFFEANKNSQVSLNLILFRLASFHLLVGERFLYDVCTGGGVGPPKENEVVRSWGLCTVHQYQMLRGGDPKIQIHCILDIWSTVLSKEN